ncbi:non-structural protein 2 [Cherax quadricarinatus densovirus]|uniref:Non-structural protein 2 n=1 Tax=Cherax quadricarinatus densovirus TaxID=1642018 RepID=A0A0E3TUJ8_9VIRU|nr:non-structural protein 2 [Cherax quadricarinatus densovirus]AKC42761.1 non-structural protein 2 [Cherax quadricarinatus densovirus]
MSKRKLEEMSPEHETEEEEDSEPEREEDRTLEKDGMTAGPKISFTAMLRRILQANLPLSQVHPGYLLGFVTMMTGETNLPVELENSLYGFQKAGQIWNNGIGKASKKGVIEYLQSCKTLMGSWFATSFDSKTLESMMTLLDAYNETQITEEDCSRYVAKIVTSTSCTTAPSATECAGATGTKRRKPTGHTLDEINVLIDEIPVEVEPQPTFKTYSSIIARKDDKLYIKKFEDSWKEYQVKVTIYRRQDLMDCPNTSEKWHYKYQEMDLNYNSGSQIWKLMSQLKYQQMEYLNEKNVKWVPKKEYS